MFKSNVKVSSNSKILDKVVVKSNVAKSNYVQSNSINKNMSSIANVSEVNFNIGVATLIVSQS